jgi:hypothetical protein
MTKMHCKRRGFLLAFGPDEQFHLEKGSDAETIYNFNKHHIDHTFCKVCGVQPYGHDHDGNGHYMTAVNLNCLEGFDTTSLKINDSDGVSV